MKKFAVVLLAVAVLVLIVLLGACSAKNPGQTEEGDIPGLLEVRIQTVPEKAEPGKPVSIRASVIQDGEPVTDANEVEFEIRKRGQEQSEMLNGKHLGEGIYAAEKTFAEAGTYVIVAHVTARGLHSMPSIDLNVGM